MLVMKCVCSLDLSVNSLNSNVFKYEDEKYVHAFIVEKPVYCWNNKWKNIWGGFEPNISELIHILYLQVFAA